MAQEVAKINVNNCSLEQLFASNTAKQLAKSFNLTPTQIAKGNNAMLQLACDKKLDGATQLSKLRFCYWLASKNYKSDKAVVPIKYEDGVQAQPQYYGLIEDVLDTKIVEAKDIICTPLYKGIDYKAKLIGDNRILTIPEIKLDDPFQTLEVIGYYAEIKTNDGEIYTSTMSKDAILNHAGTYSISYKAYKSKGYNTPWVTNFESMAMKTVLKQACNKFIKKHPFDRLQDTLEKDQIVFTDKGMEYLDNPMNKNENPANLKSNVENTLDFTIEPVSEEKVKNDSERKENN